MRLLMIEDNPTDVRMAQLHLERAKFEHELVSAGTLAAGLKLLADRPPSVVLADLGLPDADGTQVVERLVEAAPELPVIVLSGNEAEGVASVRAGAQDFLPKSELSGAVLARAIRFAVERQALTQRLAGGEGEVRARLRSAGALDLSRLRRGLSLRRDDLEAPPLQESAPSVYATLTERYGELLLAALDPARAAGVEHVEACYAVADRLAYMACVPKDLIDLHLSALAQVQGGAARREAPPALAQAAPEHLVRMLSYLASVYRQDSLRQRRSS